MSAHIPDAMLSAFVEGDLDDALAVDLAGHLDGCPMCAARAAGMEPLNTVFARIPDPQVPVGLAASALAAFEREEDGWAGSAVVPPVPARVEPAREVAIGGGMLTAAAALLALLGDPVALLAQAGLWAHAAGALGRALLLGMSPSVALPLTILVGASGTVVLVRTAWPEGLSSRDAA